MSKTSVSSTPKSFVMRHLRDGFTAAFPPDPTGQRTIAAKFVRKLLLDCVTDPTVAPVGIAITGARIEGDLCCIGFGSPAAPLPALDLSNCELTGMLELTDSCFSSVTLNNCLLSGLIAPSLNVGNGLRANDLRFPAGSSAIVDLRGLTAGGDVVLRNLGRTPAALKACQLILTQARITGAVDCSGARLVIDPRATPKSSCLADEDPAALQLERADIAGDVILTTVAGQRFEAIGGANLRGARVGGQVSCTEAKFENPGKDAFTLDRISVANSVFLNTDERRFEAFGEIRLVGAKIDGQLNCSGAHFSNPGGDALSLDQAEIGASVFLQSMEPSKGSSSNHRFEAEGTLRFVGTRIGGQLSLAGARLAVSRGTALTLIGAEIGGSVLMQSMKTHRFEAEGLLRLAGTKIGGQLSVTGAHLRALKDEALTLTGAEIGSDVIFQSMKTHRFEADGMLRLDGTKIGGQLAVTGARLRALKEEALALTGAEVGGDVCFKEAVFEDKSSAPLEVEGLVRLRGSTIGGSLECAGLFTSPKEILDFDHVSVAHSLTAMLNKKSRGEVSLRGTRVSELADSGGQGWGDKAVYEADDAIVSGVRLRLEGLTYDRLGKWDAPAKPVGGRDLFAWRIRKYSGLGVPQDIWWNRSKWLARQCGSNKPQPRDFFPQPHEQLAKVLRLMGHDYQSRRIMTHKFGHEGLCGADDKVAQLFMYLYRVGFGCGYLPIRAVLTVVFWWTLGALLTWGALHMNTTDEAIFVRSTTGVDVVRTLSKPDEAPKKSSNGKPYEAVKAPEVPCTSEEINPILYALDTMLPVFQLHMESKCEFSGAHFFWSDAARLAKALYALFGWIIVTLAALTWTGVLRREPG